MKAGKEKAGRNKRNNVNKGNKPKKGFLSPFLYPGGKSWFVKLARQWLAHRAEKPKKLIEPFAGGAGISLAAAYEGLVQSSIFGELDSDVAAVWETILNDNSQWLIKRIVSFRIGRRRVERTLARKTVSKKGQAFKCLLRNRTARGGVIPPHILAGRPNNWQF
jgi:DNA adenine methylase